MNWLLFVLLFSLSFAYTYAVEPPDKNPGKFGQHVEGDMVFTDFSGLNSGVHAFRANDKWIWPNGNVYYRLAPTITADATKALMITDAMEDISRQAPCVNFIDIVKTGLSIGAFLDIVTHGDYEMKVSALGCHSEVGYQGRRQILNLQPDDCFMSGIIKHELFHALGSVHEHSRPDVSEALEILTKNIHPNMSKNFKVEKYDYEDVKKGVDTYQTPYDLMSIMQYPANAFAFNDSLKTMKSKDPAFEGAFGYSEDFTAIDIVELNLRYNCTLEAPLVFDYTNEYFDIISSRRRMDHYAISKLENQIEVGKNKTGELEYQSEKLKTRSKNDQNEIEKLQKQSEIDTNEIEKLKNQSVIDQNKIEKLQTQSQNDQDDIEKLKTQSEIRQNKIEKLNTQSEIYQDEIKTLKFQSEIDKGEIEKLKNQSEIDQNEIEKLKRQMKADEDRFRKIEILIENMSIQLHNHKGCVDGMATSHLAIGGRIVEVRCEDDQDGSWIVIQRRGQHNNPQDFFFKTFSEYETGFGSVDKELWIGLKNIADLTKEGKWQLRVDLTDWDGKTYFALYGSFAVGLGQKYQLVISSYDDGNSTLGDSLSDVHNQNPFSAKDNDQDKAGSSNCAEKYKGGWWYRKCHDSNLNGLNFPQQEEDDKGIVWWYGKTRGYGKKTWRESTIKIRKIKV